ncbi:hypothetical protein Tsubulata_000624 [Turnera subulata]|uniref:Leucine-rich repeat-containing N-terminal plant-type domain-containing protein n=1 Tax=Turnera subulata TaxID=218843 RepID=A0A9Q0GH24_9ROSI|nr:hypothetical protein Tsubulata_000624 [Turnera subulata]
MSVSSLAELKGVEERSFSRSFRWLRRGAQWRKEGGVRGSGGGARRVLGEGGGEGQPPTDPPATFLPSSASSTPSPASPSPATLLEAHPLSSLQPPSLRSLDLSHNSLSGPIATKIQSLHHLTHLDLSSNRLNDSLPEFLVTLKTLSGTLNLSFNDFFGEIPVSYGWFPVLVSLDLRHNNLSGKVPQVGSLVNQGPTAFAENPGLCGFPLQIPCPEAVSISVPAGDQNPENPIDSIPASLPGEGKKAATGSVAVPMISRVSVVVGGSCAD